MTQSLAKFSPGHGSGTHKQCWSQRARRPSRSEATHLGIKRVFQWVWWVRLQSVVVGCFSLNLWFCLSLSLSLDCLISGMVVGLIIWSVEVVVGFFCVSVGVSHLLVLCLCLFHKKIFGFGWKFLGLNGGGGGWVCVYVCLQNVSYFSVWFERKSWFSRENVDDCSRKIYEVDFLGKMLMIVLGKFMRLVGFVCVCVFVS